MKKLYLLPIIMLLFFSLTGCRKEEQTPVTGTEELEVTQPTMLEPAVERDIDVAGTATKDVSAVLEEQLPESSVAKVEESFEEITSVDVTDWYQFQHEGYGFSFYVVRDYGVYEPVPGQFDVGSEEGAGHFFTIDIAPVGNTTLHDDDTRMTGSVVINGQTFTIEEFDDGYAKQLSYFTEHNGNEFKMTFYFTEGLDEFVDLFNNTMKTFKFF